MEVKKFKMKKTLTLILAVIIIASGMTFAFNDVSNSKWYSAIVKQISDIGIMVGDGENFRPEDNVTRAELAATILNTIEYMERDYESRMENEIDAVLSNLQSAVWIESPDGNTFGSGVFISSTGRILTAYHVVKGNDLVIVSPTGGVSAEADVLAYDEQYDLALLQMHTGGRIFRPVVISATTPQMLDRVYAIGNPFSLRNTVSMGSVSASRNNDMQMDISINSGNSGGAILNSDGELIGIALSIIDPAKGSGIGFSATLYQIEQFLKNNNN